MFSNYHKTDPTLSGEISLSLNEIRIYIRSNLNYKEFKSDFLARINEIKNCSQTVIEKKEWKDEVVKIFSKDLIGHTFKRAVLLVHMLYKRMLQSL